MTGESGPPTPASQRFAGHDPAGGHDTGGTAWAGRTLAPTGFEGDDGAGDLALAAALAAVTAPEAGETEEETLLRALSTARLVVPVVAVVAERQEQDGLTSDARSDMAAVTLTAADGTRALPAFTSVATLAAWDSRARPVPMVAQRAALAAVQEGCQVIVLDLAGPQAWTLRPSMVWALAMARPWVPAHRDEQVSAAVGDALARQHDVVGHELSPGDDGALLVTLQVRPGLSEPELQTLVTAIGEAVATDGEVRARIDAVTFRLRVSDGASGC